MSHSSGSTHTSGPTHTTGSTHPSGATHSKDHSHKHTLEQFTNAVNGNHASNLDQYLDANVEKTIDSQTVYKGLSDARQYYTKQHTDNKGSQWKIVHFPDNADQKGNTARARISYNNKTYNTTYTFTGDGKIQRIEAHTDAAQHTTGDH